MKTILLTALAIALVVPSAFAQLGKATTTKPRSGIAKAGTKVTAEKPKPLSMSGSITKVDANNITITVNSQDQTFVITPTTKVTVNFVRVQAINLHVKDYAKVTYTQSGTAMTATAIGVKRAKGTKGKKDRPCDGIDCR